MMYYSTKDPNLKVSPKEATFKGLPDDNGLFMPEYIPQVNLERNSLVETGVSVLQPFFNDIPFDQLEIIVSNALNFHIPLKRISDQVFVLELFHGPTMAFKDVGAGFLAGCLNYYAGTKKEKVTVLVATSGDTGSAVANGFYGQDNIEVIILYPEGKVSSFQEKQMTTLGGNITALKVKGVFDDCQRLVKTAFLDKEINNKLRLTSANSINIARFLAQSVYYIHGVNQWERELPPVISVPSGNFGNLTAGIIATRMGLSVDHFIASTNINHTFSDYLDTGEYTPKPSKQTLSNAMDVGDPSNFVRILDLYGHSVESIKKEISSFYFSDDQTLDAVKRVYESYGYIMDPHGAVGFLGLEKYGKPGIFLETADPYKFKESIESLGINVPVPSQAEKFQEGTPEFTVIGKEYEEFREFLANN